MVQWTKHLLCKSVDLSLNPQTHIKAQPSSICKSPYISPRRRAGRQECPWKLLVSRPRVHSSEQDREKED